LFQLAYRNTKQKGKKKHPTKASKKQCERDDNKVKRETMCTIECDLFACVVEGKRLHPHETFRMEIERWGGEGEMNLQVSLLKHAILTVVLNIPSFFPRKLQNMTQNYKTKKKKIGSKGIFPNTL
jgi:hypothetical protein